jgi:hypothetical protein
MDIYKDFAITKRTAIKYIGSTHSTFTIEQVKKPLYTDKKYADHSLQLF